MSKEELTPEARAFFAAQGAIGGKASGKRKARTSRQARKAIRARWAKSKTKTQNAKPD